MNCAPVVENLRCIKNQKTLSQKLKAITITKRNNSQFLNNVVKSGVTSQESFNFEKASQQIDEIAKYMKINPQQY